MMASQGYKFVVCDDGTGYWQKGDIEDALESLNSLACGESCRIEYPGRISTTVMQKYIDRLMQTGLDIGKGDATFGYRMPLPEKGAAFRDLIIFRRK